MADRLSALDASFLYQETRNTHMHVASCMVFEGTIDYQEFLDAFRARLHLVPRYRQKLAFPPGNIARPVWIDDPHFNLQYHVRHTALPAPGGDEQLKRLCGRLMSQALDRSKPLWETWLVDGLGGERFALIAKVHHCMVDGVSGADLMSVLFDLSLEGRELTPEPWTAPPEPSGAQLFADAVRDVATHPGEIVRGLASAARAPARALGYAGSVVQSLRQVMSPAPRTPLNVEIGPHRRVEFLRASLDDFKAVKNALGGTVNDVVLTVVTGGLRRFLEHRGIALDGLVMRATCPVSTRADHEKGALGNRVSVMTAALPVSEPDPVRRLEIVREATQKAKSSGMAVGAEAIIQLTGFAPPTILVQASRLQALTSRVANLTVTNVPGPQFPLYFCGRPMVDTFPMGLLLEGNALFVAVFSYNGVLDFSLLADYDALPDVAVIADGMEKSVQELLHRAGT
jgi:WS/DGAT/MGAT family acyltransferase